MIKANSCEECIYYKIKLESIDFFMGRVSTMGECLKKSNKEIKIYVSDFYNLCEEGRRK